MGGAGSAVAEHLHERGLTASVLHIGLPDRFVEHGPHKSQLEKVGLTAEGIENRIRERLRQAPSDRRTVNRA